MSFNSEYLRMLELDFDEARARFPAREFQVFWRIASKLANLPVQG